MQKYELKKQLKEIFVNIFHDFNSFQIDSIFVYIYGRLNLQNAKNS